MRCDELGVCQDRPIRCFGCVPSVRIIRTTSNEWEIPAYLPRVLYPASDECLPEQTTSGIDDGGDRSFKNEPWPGASAGVRAPMFGETPLSADEVGHGLRVGVL